MAAMTQTNGGTTTTMKSNGQRTINGTSNGSGAVIGQKNVSRSGTVFGFHWVTEKVDWTTTTFPDPTRIFSFLVIGIMVFRFLEAKSWDIQEAIFGFFLNPYVVLAFSLSIGVIYYALQVSGMSSLSTLSTADQWSVEWYWWNGWLYHLTMDGFSGTFHLVPVVVQQYFTLDKRFETHHVVPWIIGLMEIVCMAPCCFITIYMIITKHPLRYPMELITSTFHFTGMVVFVAAEVYEGQLNVPALDPVGVPGNRWANVKVLDLYHLTYYWFGFWICNLIWGFVPYYRIIRSLQECYDLISTNNNNNNNSSSNNKKD